MIDGSELCKPENKWILTGLLSAYSAFEYWLGKTGLVKSGSTIELLLAPIRAILNKGDK